jgi:hypothetical protein
MEDRGWVWDEDDEPAVKYASNGAEIAREGDDVWKHDYEEVLSVL